MPFNTQWLINKRVIADRIDHSLTPKLQTAHDELITNLLEQSERSTSHIILDCQDIKYPTFRKRAWIKNSRLGWLVLHNVNNPIFRLSVGLVLQILGVRYHFTETQADALSFLKSVDISLSKAEKVE